MAEKHVETLLQSPNAFTQNMQHIFSHDRKTIVHAIEKCLDDDTMFELQNKLFSDIKEMFPQYKLYKPIKRKRRDLLAGDLFTYGFSIVNATEMTELKTSIRPVSDHSLAIPPSCDDDQEGNRQRREFTNLAEMCARLKANLDSAIARIASLEATVIMTSTDMTTVKLQLLHPDDDTLITKATSAATSAATGSYQTRPHRASVHDTRANPVM